MAAEVQIKLEPEETETNEVQPDLNMEQPEFALNPIFGDHFIQIKQEVTDVNIKLEPMEDPDDACEGHIEDPDDAYKGHMEDPDDAYEGHDLDPESVLTKLEHHLYESDETIKLPRTGVVNYKEDSDDEYLPPVKSVKKGPKKSYSKLLKGWSKEDKTYPEEIMNQIDIVTIDEKARQEEYHLNLMARKQNMNYTCDSCAIGFVVLEAYQMHLKIHSPEAGAHECDICKVRLKTTDMLYQHRLRHYRRYRCSICQLLQRDKDTVAAHIMSEHLGTAFLCKYCGKDFKRPQYLSRHIKQMHTKPLHLECPVCQKVYYEKGWYRCHVRTHNEQVQNNITRKAICAHCGREFRNKQYLTRHLAVHEDRRARTCGVCDRTFKNIEVLRVHRRQHHGRNPVRDYATDEIKIARIKRNTTCPVCARVLTTPAMMTRHMRRMHTERVKRFECDYCQKCYFTKAELRSHIEWTHLQRRKHACACGRVFRSPALLRDHSLTKHLNVQQPKDKSCPICGKMFANQQVLTRHVKGHSGETYPCSECGKTFKTQSYVKIHYKIKHLNMTRAQVKAQSKRKLIMLENSEQDMNAKIIVSKKFKNNMTVEDPLNLDNFQSETVETQFLSVKKEVMDPSVPLFETFVDIQREC